MSLFFFIFFLVIGFSGSCSFVVVNGEPNPSSRRLLADAPCPMDFTILRKFIDSGRNSDTSNSSSLCHYVLQGIRLVQAEFLRKNNLFLPPLNASEYCWRAFETVANEIEPNIDIRSVCGFKTSWISEGCMNITSRAQFETLVPDSSLQDVIRNCNQSLGNNSPCASCTTSLSTLQASYLPGPAIGNVSDCTAYPFIYAGGVVNQFGPADPGTALCLYSFNSSPKDSGRKLSKGVICGVVVGCAIAVFGGVLGLGFLIKRRSKKKKAMKRKWISDVEGNASGSRLDSISASTTLIRFTLDEINSATRNFSRHNIIGKGGYGNVYKGVLPDGTEVALKRFKNCSAAGDASFTHEVEVIASVRHVNLVALRGYCTATTSLGGHQRIIVCDLMRNGSLYDHLFGSSEEKLSWPVRRRIAIGTARGLSYLHYGAQPSIIHRDIKASNILLDESFEAKVADFGLAKFTPEGMTHLSTRVAGTLGYVAPEYALYGQLTEKSDVYSFGVVLLELLSGKKAIVSNAGSDTSLVTDWAWSLVRKGRALDVIEDGMPELGPSDVLEKYVMVAVLSSHPQLHARPTMDQIVKILETDLPVPLIPDRPISLIAPIEDIEKSVSSSGSGYLSSSAGYQPFTTEVDNLSFDRSERE